MQASDLKGATFLAVKAGLTGLSGAATTYSTGATALQYAIAGKAYTKAQASGAATPTTGAVSGAAITLTPTSTVGKGVVLVWTVDVSGAVGVHESDVVDLDADTDDFLDGKAPDFPPIDLDTYCPIAYSVIKVADGSSAFTVGSSNWNATGVTITVVDILTLPFRPQQS